jgi:hypothetical protein
MPPDVLHHVGKFTECFLCPLQTYYALTTGTRILHRVYTFIEAQQKGNKLKSFFHQDELNTLLKDCQTGLQQNFDFFQVCCQFHVAAITEYIYS